jgi:uncharacterized protein YndB with AHSA1/START domain
VREPGRGSGWEPSSIIGPAASENRFFVWIEAVHRYGVPIESGFAFITDPTNWPRYWPGYVRLQPGSRWGSVGDTARLVTRLLWRERELVMTITTFVPNRLVTYRSLQDGLPEAVHGADSHQTAMGSSISSPWATSRGQASLACSIACCCRGRSGGPLSTRSLLSTMSCPRSFRR